MEEKDYQTAIATLVEFIHALPKELMTCKYMQDDIEAIKQWAQIFKSKTALTAKIAKNMVFHGIKIHSDINKVKADFKAQEYFKAGQVAGDIVYLGVGPIENGMYLQ